MKLRTWKVLFFIAVFFMLACPAQAFSPSIWGDTHWPTIMSTDAGVPTSLVYGQVWIDGVTSSPGQTSGLTADLGYGPNSLGVDPSTWTNWTPATFNTDTGNNDEFMASITPVWGGTYFYAYRYKYLAGPYLYCDLDGGPPSNFGVLTVNGPLAPVPIPGAVWLLGSGLLSLVGIGRKRLKK